MKSSNRIVTSALLVALLGGCAGSDEQQGTDGPAAVAPAASTELQPVSLESWHEEIAALEGDIVVVDFWATWCIPCIERFPHMVELSRRYASSGVRFVSTSLDDPGDEQAIAYARQFLAEQQATFANFLIDENVADSFEKLDLMTIPAVFIYGRDGELRHRLTADDPYDQFTEQDVEEAIEALLGEDST